MIHAQEAGESRIYIDWLTSMYFTVPQSRTVGQLKASNLLLEVETLHLEQQSRLEMFLKIGIGAETENVP
jgi:hypothetical protein